MYHDSLTLLSHLMETARRNTNIHHYVGLAEKLLQMWEIEQCIKVNLSLKGSERYEAAGCLECPLPLPSEKAHVKRLIITVKSTSHALSARSSWIVLGTSAVL